MKLKMYEYTVTPNIKDSNPFSIQLIDDKLLYNGQLINDNNIINTIKVFLLQQKEGIIRLGSEHPSVFKGGRQQMLSIQYDDKVYRIIGNTSSEEMKNYYLTIKNELINIIKNV